MRSSFNGRGAEAQSEMAIALYFDADTEHAILELRNTLYDAEIVPEPGVIEARPHISLAILQGEEIPFGLLRDFAAGSPPPRVQLTSLSTFPGENGIVFLAPTPDDRLLGLHRDLHERLGNHGFASRSAYEPEIWVPHCTLEKDIPRARIPQAFDVLLNAFKSLTGTLIEVGAVRYPPLEAVRVACFVPGADRR